MPRMNNAEAAARAAETLRAGGLVALPTETVYGLAADAENELAVRRIFAVKGRPQSHPLILHLGDVAMLSLFARELPETARALAETFWPGPLTMVFSRTSRVPDVITGGQDTVAIRVPAHPLAREILRRFGGAVAAPSANKFGKVSPTRAEHVRADLGDEVDLIVDGGACEVGVESTIVDVSRGPPVVLRTGGVPVEALERALGVAVPVRVSSEVRVSGSLASHYAPRAGVVLARGDEVALRVTEAMARGARVAAIAPASIALPPGVHRFEVAENAAALARELYALLREVDAAGFDVVVAALPPDAGLGRAVTDRLTRAAAPRD